MPTFVTAHRLRQAAYAPLLGSAMALMFFRILAMAHLLDVTEFATFSAALVVSGMLNMLSSLGLYLKLQRDLPVLLVRDRKDEAVLLFSQTLAAGLAIALCGGIVALSGLDIAGLAGAVLAVALLHGLSQQLFLTATLDSRSRGEPLRFAWENIVRALVTTLAILAVAYYSGSGIQAVLAEAVVALFLSGYLLKGAYARLRPAAASLAAAVRALPLLDWSSLGSLLLVSALIFTSGNIDRWLAAESLRPAKFAEYAFAWTIVLVAMSLQALVNASVFPMIAQRYAQFGRNGAFRLSFLATCVSLAAFGLAAIPLGLIAEPAVQRFFPAYADATVLFLPLGLAAGLRVADFWSSFLVIVGMEKRMLVASAASSALVIAGWYLYVSGWGGLEPYHFAVLALLTASANFLVLFALSWSVARDGSSPSIA